MWQGSGLGVSSQSAARLRVFVGLWVCLFTLSTASAFEHTFELSTTGWAEQPDTVHVAGTFNQWSRDTHPMRRGGDGLWRTAVDLDEGVHLYKFVLDGEHWIKDDVYSDASLEEPDGHGGNNSAVLIGRDFRDLDPPAPNDIKADIVTHDVDSYRHRGVVSRDQLLLAIDAQAGDVSEAYVHLLQQTAWEPVRLSVEGEKLGLETFVGLIGTTLPVTAYYFELRDGDASVLFADGGIVNDIKEARDKAFTVEMAPSFATPDWAKHAVWYQIFPERFRNGDDTNDPGDMPYETLLPWTIDWWKNHRDHGEATGDDNFYTGRGNVWRRRFGGDLQGVREKLPYLRDLGVNALYFNPVFEAESMHKYDTADFRHIDDNLGVRDDGRHYPPRFAGETDDPATWVWSPSDQVFLEFLDEAHARGFKVVIDGVFNHVGRAHPFFQDVLAKGQNSKYAGWFEITDWGDPKHWRPLDDPYSVHGKEGGIQWIAWDEANGHLPVFKNDPETGLADGPRQHIFDITARWMDPDGDGDPSDGIDGWRLDVPGDIAHPFWIEWRELVKGTNPDAFISGEIWTWAHPWLQGDQFDAVMNYQFAIPALDFFVDERDAIAPSEFAKQLNRVVFNYPMQVSMAQMNLYDSHDTDRFASMFVNPDRGYDGQNRLQDEGGEGYQKRPPDRTERVRQMQAAALQATFVGAPMIYYGTEAGMWSPDDPSNRQPMVWEDRQPYEGYGVEFQDDIYQGYRRLFALRGSLPALRVGGFRVILTDDDQGVLAFERRLGDDVVYVVFNRSADKSVVDLPMDEGVYINALSPSSVGVTGDSPEDPRPVLFRKQGASYVQPTDGVVNMTMPPYNTTVFVPYQAIPSEQQLADRLLQRVRDAEERRKNNARIAEETRQLEEAAAKAQEQADEATTQPRPEPTP